MAKTKKYSSVVNIDQLAKEFGIPSWDKVSEYNVDGIMESGVYAVQEARKEAEGNDEELSEAEEEKIREEAEGDADRELFSQWHNATMSAIESLFEAHDLALDPKGRDRHPYEYDVRPNRDWRDSAQKIMETINGVGMFEFADLDEFLDSGPWTTKEAVLSHLHWIKDWPEVYGETSAVSRYERAWR